MLYAERLKLCRGFSKPALHVKPACCTVSAASCYAKIAVLIRKCFTHTVHIADGFLPLIAALKIPTFSRRVFKFNASGRCF